MSASLHSRGDPAKASDDFDNLDLLEDSSIADSMLQWAPPSIKLQDNHMKPSYRFGATIGVINMQEQA